MFLFLYRNQFGIKNKNMKNKHFTLLAILLVFVITNGDAVVYDLFGRMVATTKYHNGRIDFETSTLARGVYIVRISSASGVVTRKIVKD